MTQTDTPEPADFAFMLRLWPTRTATGFVWRASLEDPHSGERIGFDSLAALVAHLQALTAVASDAPPAAHPGEG